jgi:hypothetical protein
MEGWTCPKYTLGIYRSTTLKLPCAVNVRNKKVPGKVLNIVVWSHSHKKIAHPLNHDLKKNEPGQKNAKSSEIKWSSGQSNIDYMWLSWPKNRP